MFQKSYTVTLNDKTLYTHQHRGYLSRRDLGLTSPLPTSPRGVVISGRASEAESHINTSKKSDSEDAEFLLW